MVGDSNRFSVSSRLDYGLAVFGEDGPKVMVRTFRMFQGAAAAPEDITPKLCVMCCSCAESGFLGWPAVCLAAIAVNEACHVNFLLPSAGHVNVVGAVARCVVDVEISAHVDQPCRGDEQLP